MDEIVKAIVSIAIAIIGVAILSVLVSPKSQTSKVIQASASGFGNSLAVAMTPVTGEHVRIDTSYPNSGGNIGAFQGGYPELNYGPNLG
jgi:hypothetical protein